MEREKITGSSEIAINESENCKTRDVVVFEKAVGEREKEKRRKGKRKKIERLETKIEYMYRVEALVIAI